ncbi:hypothetical protein G9A89_009658 [Geosiphon pyriformis]|nr:hypothetical protein G9A89_009658 [Geosiphon pyriformis]
MPRHSKNNTALSFFTYAEGQALDYGTKKVPSGLDLIDLYSQQRLGRDSMREFDACYLCLQRARSPVCCSQGHLYCKECIYENILAQKKEIKRQQVLLEQREKDELEVKKRKEELAKEAIIHDFERQQLRIAPNSTIKRQENFGEGFKKREKFNEISVEGAGIKDEDVISNNFTIKSKNSDESEKNIQGVNAEGILEHTEKTIEVSSQVAGRKRNFHLDEEELSEISKREQKETLQRLEAERIAASKPKLPNFWLPSLTPSAEPDKIPSVKLHTMCTASDPEHPISVKSLVETKFTEIVEINGKTKNFVCPSCRKGLTNTVKISLLKSCGHVMCGVCVDKFVKKAKRCFVCEERCKDKDIADMSGTGFSSGGGKVVAQKFDVAKFIRFFSSIHKNRINRVMTNFSLTNSYHVHNSLDQGEMFSFLLWHIFYDPLLCKVKHQESVCRYRLNSHFISKSSHTKSQTRLSSFFAAGAFVNDTIWVGSSQSAIQHIFNVAGKFFWINNISINNNKMVAFPINSRTSNFSLFISGSPISIAKKGESYEYLGIFLSTKGLSKPNLAKANSDVCFFTNLVLKKTISDKQLLYLVLVVLYPIVSYKTQFSFVPVGMYNKQWKRLDPHGLVSKWFKISVIFFNDLAFSSAHFLVLSRISSGSLSVYMDGSLKNLGTVGYKADAAAFFENINLGLDIGISDLMLSTMAEL